MILKKRGKKSYTKKGYLCYHSDKITELIDNNNIGLAKRMVLDLLVDNPYDNILRFQLARIYILEKKEEEALQILEESNEEEKVFMKLTSLCIKLNKEDKLYYLYQKYFCDDYYKKMYENDHRYVLLSISLNKKYNPNYKLNISDLSYHEKQIYSYDKEEAIRHIINNHCFSLEYDKGIFADGIDIRELYDRVLEYINNHEDEGYLTQIITDSFYFYYPGIGKTRDSGLYDCLFVCVNTGTKDIITMFPVSKRRDVEYVRLDEKRVSKVRQKSLKATSGLERFQRKYNKDN
jgi:tetratricopeptide (TPR) repeat protein